MDPGSKSSCRHGVQVCQPSYLTVQRWGDCVPAPTKEELLLDLCADGLDNDCDGKKDSKDLDCICTPERTAPCYTGAPSTRSVGGCQDGTRTCPSSGVWSRCKGQTLPQPEICNSVDDDCNGVIDDNCKTDEPVIGSPESIHPEESTNHRDAGPVEGNTPKESGPPDEPSVLPEGGVLDQSKEPDFLPVESSQGETSSEQQDTSVEQVETPEGEAFSTESSEHEQSSPELEGPPEEMASLDASESSKPDAVEAVPEGTTPENTGPPEPQEPVLDGGEGHPDSFEGPAPQETTPDGGFSSPDSREPTKGAWLLPRCYELRYPHHSFSSPHYRSRRA